MTYSVLMADEAHWRPSNQMKVDNTDLGRQLGATTVGGRLWRLRPGQASTLHRHRTQAELYVVLEGTGRLRIDDELFTMPPLSSAHVEADHVRQVFNDTDADQLWLIVGAPIEEANTLVLTEDDMAFHYPHGPKALPPELGGGQFTG